MKKILISQWVPAEWIAMYDGIYEIVTPSMEKRAYSYEEVYDMIEDYDAYFIMGNTGDKSLIDKAKKLKVIANFGVGYNNIDWNYATKVGLPVVNTPTTVTEATAEHAVALIMATMRGIARYDREVRRGIWNSPNFSDLNCEVYGRTLGIIGFGRIGKMVCQKAKGLGMHVIYYDLFRASEEIEKEYQATYMSFDEVIKNSDCITLHMPYVPENHHIIHAETFRQMKKSAYLINAARGPVVDEKALAAALKSGEIKGAGLDVFEDEPNVSPELLELDNVTLTPHIASCTLKTRRNMCAEALSGIAGVLEGDKPYNVINPEVLG